MKINESDIPTYNYLPTYLTFGCITFHKSSQLGIGSLDPTFLYRSAGVQQHHLAAFQYATRHAVGDDLRQGRNSRATRDQRQLRCGTGEGWQVQG